MGAKGTGVRPENSGGHKVTAVEEFEDCPAPGLLATWWACETVFNIFGIAKRKGRGEEGGMFIVIAKLFRAIPRSRILRKEQ